jgi:hypothetical protein
MTLNDVKNSEDMIDCTLATVGEMVYKRNIKKSEFERQCNIAQAGIDFLGAKTYDFKGNRCKDFCKV